MYLGSEETENQRIIIPRGEGKVFFFFFNFMSQTRITLQAKAFYFGFYLIG